MAFISGFGGTITFSGVAGVGSPTAVIPVRSFTMTIERASLDVTLLSDYREKRLPGRIRRSGTLTLYRQTGTTAGTGDVALRTHLLPDNLADATGAPATLSLKYTDQGSIEYNEWGTGTNAFPIHITSAQLAENGTDMALWELSWEEQ